MHDFIFFFFKKKKNFSKNYQQSVKQFVPRSVLILCLPRSVSKVLTKISACDTSNRQRVSSAGTMPDHSKQKFRKCITLLFSRDCFLRNRIGANNAQLERGGLIHLQRDVKLK